MNIPRSDIEKIVQDGAQAPSGENCQPWRFIVKGNVISIFNIPEADQSLYNSKQKGSYIAHGALLENMTLSAQHHGYTLAIALFPNKDEETHVSDVVITKNAHHHVNSLDGNLYEVMYKRCTNRKDFTGEKLSQEEKHALVDSVKHLGFNELLIIDNDAHMKKVGMALGTNERILFENKELHNFFYSHIIWDKKDEKKSGGFFIDTLELLPHQLQAVKIIKNWPVLKILNIVPGVSKLIAKENGEKYAASGTISALIMRGTTRADYVNLGRSVERVWLTATALGIAMHPCNGTIYLMGHVMDSGTASFTGEQLTVLQKSYDDIIQSFGAEESHIGFIFRMGKADSPTAVAKRIAPVVDYI